MQWLVVKRRRRESELNEVYRGRGEGDKGGGGGRRRRGKGGGARSDLQSTLCWCEIRQII